jgi:hypothetical protein
VRPVAGLEVRVAADVDELEIEPKLHLQVADDLARTPAEGTVRRVIERDLAGYG